MTLEEKLTGGGHGYEYAATPPQLHLWGQTMDKVEGAAGTYLCNTTFKPAGMYLATARQVYALVPPGKRQQYPLCYGMACRYITGQCHMGCKLV